MVEETQPPLILIAEDQAMLRDVYSSALARSGYATFAVATGSEVLAAISTQRPAALILDHNMPGRTGADLVHHIRQTAAIAHLPILIATGDIIPEAASPDADPLTAFLQKPIELDRLVGCIETLLAVGQPEQHETRTANPRRDADRPASIPSFSAVLTAAQEGKATAFELIYRALNRRVYSFARNRGAQGPEDLVSDVFLQVFVGLPSFTGTQGQFEAWVFTIARNKMIDDARRRSRRPIEVAGDLGSSLVIPACDDVEEVVVDRLSTESVLHHLDMLTPDQRDVVLLRVVSDLTIETVAEILEKQPTAIKALQRRAFAAIARNLSTEPADR